MRIHELAKKYDIESKEIISILEEKGVEAKSHMSAIPDELVDFVEKKVAAHKGKIAETEKAKPHHPAHQKEEKHEIKHAPEAKKAVKKEETQHAEKPAEPKTARPEQKPAPAPEAPAPEIKAPAVQAPAPAMPVTPAVPAPPAVPVKELIEVNRGVTVGELAQRLEIKSTELIKKLMSMGVLASINQTMGEDVIQLVAEEFGKEVKFKDIYGDSIFDEAEDKPEDMKPRAPIVTIMGHVDHGKTSLLDAVRQSDIVSKEHGGITQKIGAYRVQTKKGDIVFIDTPGHEAFTAMRARGAQATDIVILIVAADDGVMPQTVEAIDHAKAAGAPIIVAINKIDKDGAQPDRVKQELTKYNLISEEWGGKTQFVLISAKKKIGIDELLDKILLEAEMLELKTNLHKKAIGVIIEGKLDKGRGPIGTVLIQKGKIAIGDPFITNYTFGKVKALIDDKGSRLKEAGAVIPVEVLGFDEVPNAGDKFRVMESEKEVRQISERRGEDLRRMAEERKKKKITLEDLAAKIKMGAEKKLFLILKGDSQGSIGALSDSISKLSAESDINVNIIHSDVGDITESDVLLADASNAVIIGFFVAINSAAKELAKKEGVEIKIYHIIYEVVDAIKAAMEGMLEPEYEQVKIGEAEVRQIFKVVSEDKFIAGSYVKSGNAYNDSIASVYRGGYEILKGNVSSLRRFKDTVKEVKEGYECGVIIEGYREPKEGDVIVFYEERQKVKKL